MLRLRVAICALLPALLSPTAVAVSHSAAASEPGSPAGPTAQVRFWAGTQFPYVVEPRIRFVVDASASTESEPTSIDVRVSRTPMRSVRRSTWTSPGRLQGLVPTARGPEFGLGPNDTRKLVWLRVAQGEILCVSARATDAAGVVGPWSGRSCVIRFLDESRLRGHGDLRTDRGEGFYQGTATHIYPGGSLVLRGVPRGAGVAVLYERRRLNETPSGSILSTGSGAHPQRGNCGLGVSSFFDRLRHLDECPDSTLRRGPITFHTDREVPSHAVDGVVVVPPWATELPRQLRQTGDAGADDLG